MRRVLTLALTAVMALSLTACGGSNKETKGDIEIAEYRGLQVYSDELNVDSQYDSTISQMLQSKSTTEQKKDGKVEKTDTVNIDYVGSIDGFQFEGGSATGTDLDIDNNTFIDGFASGLIGKKVGSTVDLNLTFPEDYSNTTKDADGKEMKLAGKKVLFKVTINSRTVTVTPEYTDEFVAKNFSAIGKTKAEMDAYLKKRLQISAAMSAVWTDYVEKCKVKSYPSKEVESYSDILNDRYVSSLQSNYSADLKTYLKACGKTQKDYDKKLKDDSEKVIKQQMVIDEIVSKEKVKINADSKDYKKKALIFAELNGLDSVETLENYYGKDSIVTQLNLEQAQEVIFDNVKVVEGKRPGQEETTTAAK